MQGINSLYCFFYPSSSVRLVLSHASFPFLLVFSSYLFLLTTLGLPLLELLCILDIRVGRINVEF